MNDQLTIFAEAFTSIEHRSGEQFDIARNALRSAVDVIVTGRRDSDSLDTIEIANTVVELIAKGEV